MPFALATRKTLDWFSVRLNGREIDQVPYDVKANMTAAEVKKSLVDHDGYDPRITVAKVRN